MGYEEERVAGDRLVPTTPILVREWDPRVGDGLKKAGGGECALRCWRGHKCSGKCEEGGKVMKCGTELARGISSRRHTDQT